MGPVYEVVSCERKPDGVYFAVYSDNIHRLEMMVAWKSGQLVPLLTCQVTFVIACGRKGTNPEPHLALLTLGIHLGLYPHEGGSNSTFTRCLLCSKYKPQDCHPMRTCHVCGSYYSRKDHLKPFHPKPLMVEENEGGTLGI